ncbi:MAG: GtrA family protein [Chitinophagaceae bacterium]
MTFLKANIASLVASATDYLVTVLLVSGLHFYPVAGSITGTTIGGVVNFLMGRHWVFGTGDERPYNQAMRYLLVWVGNLLLNAGGVYLLTGPMGLHYMIAKVTISVLVAVGYNYPMQKRYVFRNN